MKNTKRLLIILCAAALLSAMIFSIGVTAATGDSNVVSGSATSISEYFDMKKITEYGFEDGGRVNTLFGNKIQNGGAGGVYETNSLWSYATPIYRDEISKYFFAMDLTKNANGDHNYIQPVLAQPPGTANIEKSPQYGFVAEFDIAFFTPVIPVTEPFVHEILGAAYEDVNGNVLYISGNDYVDEARRVAYKDYAGKTIFNTGSSLVLPNNSGDREAYITAEETMLYKNESGAFYDQDGTRVASVDESTLTKATVELFADKKLGADDVVIYETPVKIPLTDQNGNEILEDGEPVMIEKVQKDPSASVNLNFQIEMLNTGTVNDGSVTVLDITAQSSTGKVVIKQGSYKYEANLDEWIHLAIQYDADTLLTYVYVGRDDTVYTDAATGEKKVGRQLIGQFNSFDSGRGLLVYPLSFRLSSHSNSGLVGYDNFLAYQGTSIHDPDLLTSLSALEQFIYLSGILEDEDNTIPAVISYEAYEYIRSNFIAEYYDSSTGTVKPAFSGNTNIENAVGVYAKYANDTDGIMTNLKREISNENLTKYKFYVDNAVSVERTLENSVERNSKITAAEKFLSSVGSSILRDEEFYQYQKALDDFAELTRQDENAKEFVTYMKLFDASVKYGASLNRINNHYQNAKLYYEKDISNYKDFKEDSDSYKNLKFATELYLGTNTQAGAADVVASTTKKNNSDRFIGIVNTMKNSSCGNWANDGVEVENLWKMALDILLDNDYDSSVSGMQDARAIFDSANDYFWKKMQSEHKAILKERLSGFNTSASYVDKAAICTYVERYIELNARYIDMEDVELKGLVSTTEAYKAQLGTVEGDYAKLLVQNTTTFVNMMKYTDMYDSYADLKPLFDEITELYYTMNFKSDTIPEEEINLYLEKYELLRAKITATETECMIFITNTKTLSSASDTATIYTALAQCCECLDNLDPTYSGITEAKAVFDTQYSKYVSNAKTVNAQIEQTANVSCSLRGNWSFDAIVSYFKSIFN